MRGSISGEASPPYQEPWGRGRAPKPTFSSQKLLEEKAWFPRDGCRAPPGQNERERAQKKTRGEKGRLPRNDPLAPAWGWCHTDPQTSQNSWARPRGAIHSSPGAVPEWRRTQAHGLAVFPAAAGGLHGGMSPVSAPRPTVPRHPGLAAPSASGQLFLPCVCSCLWHPQDPSLGPT